MTAIFLKTMTIVNKLALIILTLVVLTVQANSIRIFTLSADEWERPRSGQIIPQFESLNAAVRYWDKGIDASILISYPGGDSGEIWASELRSWLVSLGIPADYILMLAGSQEVDEIKILVGNRQELLQ